MFLRAVRRVASSSPNAQKRFFLETPNRVQNIRSEHFADRAKGDYLTGKPTYVRGKAGATSFAVAGGLLVVGTTMIARGFYNMSHGINKKE